MVDEVAHPIPSWFPRRLPHVGEKPRLKVEEHEREVDEQPRDTGNYTVSHGVSNLFVEEKEWKKENGKELDGSAQSQRDGAQVFVLLKVEIDRQQAEEDGEQYYVWEIIDLSEHIPYVRLGKQILIDARNGEILFELPAGESGPRPTPVPTPPPPEESPTPTEEETPLPPPTKPLPAYTLDITFPSMPVMVRKGESVTLPVAIKSWADEPIKIRLALVSSPDWAVPLPEFITYEVEGYLTVNPHETVHTQMVIKVSEDAELGEYSFELHGELEKPVEGYSGIAYGFSLVVVS